MVATCNAGTDTALCSNYSRIRQTIENNGLILIALMMVAIYWTFDSIASAKI